MSVHSSDSMQPPPPQVGISVDDPVSLAAHCHTCVPPTPPTPFVSKTMGELLQRWIDGRRKYWSRQPVQETTTRQDGIAYALTHTWPIHHDIDEQLRTKLQEPPLKQLHKCRESLADHVLASHSDIDKFYGIVLGIAVLPIAASTLQDVRVTNRGVAVNTATTGIPLLLVTLDMVLILFVLIRTCTLQRHYTLMWKQRQSQEHDLANDGAADRTLTAYNDVKHLSKQLNRNAHCSREAGLTIFATTSLLLTDLVVQYAVACTLGDTEVSLVLMASIVIAVWLFVLTSLAAYVHDHGNPSSRFIPSSWQDWRAESEHHSHAGRPTKLVDAATDVLQTADTAGQYYQVLFPLLRLSLADDRPSVLSTAGDVFLMSDENGHCYISYEQRVFQSWSGDLFHFHVFCYSDGADEPTLHGVFHAHLLFWAWQPAMRVRTYDQLHQWRPNGRRLSQVIENIGRIRLRLMYFG